MGTFEARSFEAGAAADRSAPRVTGRVLEIQRMSTEDGPGLRTTLFLKGCSLRCAWCHNPESISPSPEPHWTASRCLACGLCAAECRRGAIRLDAGRVSFDRALCDGCGDCAAECPSAAIELWGRAAGADEIAAELLRDKAYFGSDGGVTISGGEACLQAPFARAVFDLVREAGCGTALDTCGMCSADQFVEAAGGADLILFDLKDSDPARHEASTGGGLERVLSNFRLALGMVEDSRRRSGAAGGAGRRPMALWIRTPIIPGYTDFEDNVRGTARMLAREATGLVDRWELCAFNKLGAGKYEALGRAWPLAGAPMMGAQEMGALVGAAVAEGWPADRIAWTGMTRRES